MRILLFEVNPFSPPTLPISLGYLAAFLIKHGFEVKIINLSQKGEYSIKELEKIIKEFSPQLVGFSTYQRNILYVLGIAKFIKEINKEIKIILGGPQITFMPSLALKDMPMVDYFCRSEGELTLLEVAKAIESGNPFGGVKGVTYKINGEIVETERIEGYEELDKYPSPHLMEIFDYSEIDEIILLTSRGCPFNCIFCYTPVASGYKIRFHSVERVIEEIKWVVKKGKNRIWFADPNFSFKKERIYQILEEILKEGLKVNIWLETRADLIDGEMLKLMKKAGVHTIAYGLESASEKVLKTVRKRLSLEQLERAIYLTQKYGIEVEVFSQYALPGETFEEALGTLEFVKSHGIKIQGNSNAQQMQLYFGAPVTDDYKKFGIKPFPEKRPSYISIGDRYETQTMTKEEIAIVKSLWAKNSLDKGRRIVS
uniref:B12-binding domain-containing radical SAM protein n=1 Tax=Thermodesulfobacterium geofontis TaxID=1295609 RepID=A0A7V6CD25_9BACT